MAVGGVIAGRSWNTRRSERYSLNSKNCNSQSRVQTNLGLHWTRRCASVYISDVTGAAPVMWCVMRRSKLVSVLLLFALAASAAALGLLWRNPGPVQVVRDHLLDSSDPDRRMVTLRLGNGSTMCRQLRNHVEARVRGQWTGPWEVFSGDDKLCFVVPAEADACRLLVQMQRRSLYERANIFFERCRLANSLPKLCDWIACRFPNKHAPAKDVTVELDLPRKPHNDPLHWTGSSRFSLGALAILLAAAPGQ